MPNKSPRSSPWTSVPGAWCRRLQVGGVYALGPRSTAPRSWLLGESGREGRPLEGCLERRPDGNNESVRAVLGSDINVLCGSSETKNLIYNSNQEHSLLLCNKVI